MRTGEASLQVDSIEAVHPKYLKGYHSKGHSYSKLDSDGLNYSAVGRLYGRPSIRFLGEEYNGSVRHHVLGGSMDRGGALFSTSYKKATSLVNLPNASLDVVRRVPLRV